MSLWSTINRNVFRRTSTFALTVAAGTFFFERAFDVISLNIFESINKGVYVLVIIGCPLWTATLALTMIHRHKGTNRHNNFKLWKDIKHKYET